MGNPYLISPPISAVNTSVTVASQRQANSSTNAIDIGLLGDWNFETGVGSIAYDSSGNAEDGSLIGILPPLWSRDAAVGHFSLFFNALYQSSVSLPYLSLSWNHSIVAWIKTSSMGGPMPILSIFSTFPNNNSSATLEISQGILRYSISLNGTTLLSVNASNFIVADGQWHMIALVVSNIFIHLMVDNEVTMASQNLLFNPYVFSDFKDLFNSISIGGDNTASFFNGNVDDVRIYGQALSAKEIISIFCKIIQYLKGCLEMWIAPHRYGQTKKKYLLTVSNYS